MLELGSLRNRADLKSNLKRAERDRFTSLELFLRPQLTPMALTIAGPDESTPDGIDCFNCSM
jgi:hypothetical protein